MTGNFWMIIVAGTVMGSAVSALARKLGGNIMISEGRTPLPYRISQVMMDSVIISGFAILSMIAFASSPMIQNGITADGDTAGLLISGVFGSFFAAAAWSDTRTSITPDTLVGGFLAAFFAMKMMIFFPGAGIGWTAAAAIFGICVFATLCLAFQNIESWRTTPSDGAFMIVILLAPASMTALFINIVAMIVVWIALMNRPEIALGMVSAREREYVESILADVYGEDSERRQDWLPYGPMSIFTVSIAMAANAFISMNA